MTTICIDPGHGGQHPGACYFETEEKDLTLSTSLMLKEALEKEGYKVVMTRTEDTHISLIDRCKVSNESKCDIFLSIHYNASYNKHIRGIETYYFSEKTRQLAAFIHNGIVMKAKAKDRGIHENHKYTVLRHTAAKAFVIEGGYMSNKSENELIRNRDYQRSIVDGIVVGLKKGGL